MTLSNDEAKKRDKLQEMVILWGCFVYTFTNGRVCFIMTNLNMKEQTNTQFLTLSNQIHATTDCLINTIQRQGWNQSGKPKKPGKVRESKIYLKSQRTY